MEKFVQIDHKGFYLLMLFDWENGGDGNKIECLVREEK